jgi:hypothetical protein
MHQEKAEARLQRMEALLEGLRSCGKRMTACQETTEARIRIRQEPREALKEASLGTMESSVAKTGVSRLITYMILHIRFNYAMKCCLTSPFPLYVM